MIEFMEDDIQQQQSATSNESENNTPTMTANFPRPVEESAPSAVAISATTTLPFRDTQKIPTFQLDPSLLNLKQVQLLFRKAGITRTSRSIERYCQDGKLDSRQDPSTRAHYVTPESVQTLIKYFKDKQQLRQETLVDEEETKLSDSRETGDENSSTGARQTPEVSHDENRTGATSEKFQELEAKIRSLEIDKAARDQVIESLNTALHRSSEIFSERIAQQAYKAGVAEAKLQAIEAPRNRGGDSATQKGQSNVIETYRAIDDASSVDEREETNHG